MQKLVMGNAHGTSHPNGRSYGGKRGAMPTYRYRLLELPSEPTYNEMSNIENMRRRPSVESVTYVRRDSLLTSQLEHIQKLFF